MFSSHIDCLKASFRFSGRLSRRVFWQFIVLNTLVAFSFGIVGSISDMPFLGNIYLVITYIPILSAGFRRMHDVGKSGWLFLIPVYNVILALQKGKQA